VPPQASAIDGFDYRLHNSAGTSNPFLLTYAWAPVFLDNEANETPDTAQEIRIPCEISGRIEKRHDRDWYSFIAKKNGVYNIELFGDRLGAQGDFYFLLRKASGKQELVEADDNPDVLSPVKFSTRTEDPPVYRFTVPEDGKYQLLVSSREADMRAGP